MFNINPKPVRSQQRFPVYYTGALGANNPPIKLSGSHVVPLPNPGEAFPFLCDELMYRLLQIATSFNIENETYCAVTRDPYVAQKAKSALEGNSEPQPKSLEMTDEELLAEIERRKLSTKPKTSRKAGVNN